MCETYSGEVGEMAIYNGYKQKPKSVKHFKKFLCNGEGILGDCNKSDQRKDELQKPVILAVIKMGDAARFNAQIGMHMKFSFSKQLSFYAA